MAYSGVRISEAIKRAPAQLRALYNSAVDVGTKSGLNSESAETLGFRAIQHSGWIFAGGEWKRFGPNVLEKVNLRVAAQQPDKRYVVTDVDVFYPNAVKGTDEESVFTAKDIRDAIENTNANIAAGGQKPALAKDHPHLLQKMTGVPSMSYGSAINWRPSARGEYWATCDLVDVDPELIEEWRDHKWTGLSAALVCDSGKTNVRFGHVALLGVDAQALARLPITEVFSASTNGVEACSVYFSADESAITKGFTMPLAGNKSAAFSALSKAYSAMGAAMASFCSGEEGASDKMKKAHSDYCAVKKQYAAEFDGEEHPDADKDMELINDVLEGAEKDHKEAKEGEEYAVDQNPDSIVEESPDLTGTAGHEQMQNEVEPPKKSGSEFSADDMSNLPPALRKFLHNQAKVIASMSKVISKINTESKTTEFSAYVDDLIRQGHSIDKDASIAMFSACTTDASVAAFKAMLAKTPKISLAGMGSLSEDADTAAGTSSEDDQVMKLIRQHSRGQFSTNMNDADMKSCLEVSKTIAGMFHGGK